MEKKEIIDLVRARITEQLEEKENENIRFETRVLNAQYANGYIMGLIMFLSDIDYDVFVDTYQEFKPEIEKKTRFVNELYGWKG